MPIIKIEFYPGSNDEMDVTGEKPKRVYHCHTVEDALAAIGQIERHEVLPLVDEVAEIKARTF